MLKQGVLILRFCKEVKKRATKILPVSHLIIIVEVHEHTRSAILPTHSPLAVTSPMFSPLAKAL